MTDKKLTDKEIVKALECCSNRYDCYSCEYYNQYCKGDMNVTLKDALDLINRLQAKVDDLERNDLPRCKDALRRANEIGVELQAENERLCAEVDELIISKDLLFDEAEALIKKAKSEAYKEFAERLCDGRVSNDNTVILAKRLLKELVGEDKCS